MRKEELRFNTNAKLERLIGRELITNNIIAVFELIKNSYDAFAAEVDIDFLEFATTGKDEDLKNQLKEVISNSSSQIIIADHGRGMTFKQIQANWMEIGTTNKDGVYSLTGEVDGIEVTRVINGEKGIGRFGTDKLGSKLTMISVGEKNNNQKEKSVLNIDWDLFNDHEKNLQEISFSCEVENVPKDVKTGVTLIIAGLRDQWKGKDIVHLKKQLKKMISPFSQDKDAFTISIGFNGNKREKIVNDSFDYAKTGIQASLDEVGNMQYTIFDKEYRKENRFLLPAPSFGPISLRIIYMNLSDKRAFAKRNNASTREYGNIKLFRDDFRILPYGEAQNDWLGIDNKHAQAVFRTLGTRDIIGYVQITKEKNPMLKDATSRQGLNEDTDEFEDFTAFIWRCLELLQEYIFSKIKEEAEKDGKIIDNTVDEIKDEIYVFKKEIPKLFENTSLSLEEKNALAKQALQSFSSIEKNINRVETANKQLSKRLGVMEKIVGAENMLYDIIHAIKNKLDTLEAMVYSVERQAKKKNLDFDDESSNQLFKDISSMVIAALNRTAPDRLKNEVILLSDVVNSFVRQKKLIYPDIKFAVNEMSINWTRIRCNVAGLRIALDDLMSNSIKAFRNDCEKMIEISIVRDNNMVDLYFEDNGVGIKEDVAPFIFNVTFTSTFGTGIGLASVYQYMKEQKGNISCISNGHLGGALFKLSFPIVGGDDSGKII